LNVRISLITPNLAHDASGLFEIVKRILENPLVGQGDAVVVVRANTAA
jgi:hypothetical protein